MGQRRPRRLVTNTVQPGEDHKPGAPMQVRSENRTADEAQSQAGSLEVAEPEAVSEPEPIPPDEGAKSFGEGQRCWAIVEISEDRLRATLTAMALNGLVLTAQELARDLGHVFGLQGHFDGKVLRQLIEQAKVDAVRGTYPIAHGTPAKPGQDGRVELDCVKGHGEAVAQSLVTDYAGALAGASLEEVIAAKVSGITVAPGQVVAHIVAPTEGTPGKDMLGKPLTSPGAAVLIQAGSHTRLDEDQIVAEVFGYVRRSGETFEVVPPVWIPKEGMEAYLIHFPELLRQESYEPEWILGALSAAGVTHGVDKEAIDALCADWPAATEADAILVAAGSDPEDGEDTHVDFAFDPSKRAGAVRADGSIDFRERNAVVGVSQGDLIGKLVSAAAAIPGSDILGKELPAKDGEDKNIAAGENVTTKSEDGTTVFYSDIDGAVSISAEVIEVQPIFTVSGDVDYETGNIDVPMNVEIGGSVRSGFKIKSGGSVIIGGVLEPGCEVIAADDVIVANGLFGETTRVTAGGNVETKMIQNATVTLQGDLRVGSFIYNAIVRAGGTVTVEEGGGVRAGSIIGGEVIAGKHVRAKWIGSAEEARTLVGIGASPQQHRELLKAEGCLVSSNREISRLVEALGLRSATPEAMTARARRIGSDAERGRIEAQIADLEAVLREKSEAQSTLQRIEEEVEAAVAGGKVRATTIFSNVHLEFGGQVSRVDQTVTDAEFYMSKEGMRWRPK